SSFMCEAVRALQK
ncbi:acrB/AcrD/AcrF family protein, partial [Vibrio parahaemolyticus V-223/04]